MVAVWFGGRMWLLSFWLSLASASEKCIIFLEVEGMTWRHSCPERVTFLLKSVPNVLRATTSFYDKESKIKASNELCEKNGQQPLLDILNENSYSATVISVDWDNIFPRSSTFQARHRFLEHTLSIVLWLDQRRRIQSDRNYSQILLKWAVHIQWLQDKKSSHHILLWPLHHPWQTVDFQWE